jgi:hypothetical protein
LMVRTDTLGSTKNSLEKEADRILKNAGRGDLIL